MDSVSMVEDFWAAVWKARNPEAIDRFVVDDFIITTGGVDIVTKHSSRVASRWRITGKNNGVLGTVPDQNQSPSPARPYGPYAKTATCCTTGSNAVLGNCFSS
jgi:hypothetical protein